VTADTFAEELLAQVAVDQPDVRELARLVSLAVRIEPPLLRHLRLEFLPHADAGTESDLWWSPLIASRSVDTAVLEAGVTRRLRQELAERPEQLDRAYHTLHAVHRGTSPLLELEEEVIWLGLKGGPGAELRIEAALRRALRAMLDQPERELNLARWADRAIPTLPPVALGTETAGLLALAASSRLGAGSGLLHEPRDVGIPDGAGWVVSSEHASGQTRIGIRLLPGKLEFTPAGLRGSGSLGLAGATPMLGEVRWEGGAGARAPVVIQEGAAIDLPAGVAALTLRTQFGEEFQITAPVARVEQVPRYKVAKVLVVGPAGAGIPLLIDQIAGPSREPLSSASRIRTATIGISDEDTREQYHLALWAASDEPLWPLALDLEDAHAVLVVASPGQAEAQIGDWLKRVREAGSDVPVLPVLVAAEARNRTSEALERELTAAAASLELPVLDTSSRQSIRTGVFTRVDWTRVSGAGSEEEFTSFVQCLPGGARNPQAIATDDRGLAAALTSAGLSAELQAQLPDVLRLAQVLGRVRALTGSRPDDRLLVRYDSFAEGVLDMLVRAQRGRNGLPVGNLTGLTGLGMGDGILVEPRPLFLHELVRLGIAFSEGEEYFVPGFLKVTATGDFPASLAAPVIGLRWLGAVVPVWLGILVKLSRDKVLRMGRIGPDWAECTLLDSVAAKGDPRSSGGLPLGIRYTQDGNAAELRVWTVGNREREARAQVTQLLQNEVLSRIPTGTTLHTLEEEQTTLAEQNPSAKPSSVSSAPRAKPSSRYAVFVSYAAADRDEYLSQFVTDLSREVRGLLGLEEPIAFFDQEAIGPGSDWAETTREAIGSASAGVCLLSPAYLHSERCGKELAILMRRAAMRPPGMTGPPGGVLPVVWRPLYFVESLPDPLRDWQLAPPDQPEEYRREGLHYFLRIRDLRDTYEQLTRGLGRWLAGAIQDPLPALDVPGWSEIPNAFVQSPTALEQEQVESGPTTARLAVIGATVDWTPFTQTLGAIALEASSRLGVRMLSSGVQEGENLEELVETTGRNGNPLVVLICVGVSSPASLESVDRVIRRVASTHVTLLAVGAVRSDEAWQRVLDLLDVAVVAHAEITASDDQLRSGITTGLLKARERILARGHGGRQQNPPASGDLRPPRFMA
jgi:TIR domain